MSEYVSVFVKMSHYVGVQHCAVRGRRFEKKQQQNNKKYAFSHCPFDGIPYFSLSAHQKKVISNVI